MGATGTNAVAPANRENSDTAVVDAFMVLSVMFV